MTQLKPVRARKILSGNIVDRKFTHHKLSHHLGCSAALWKSYTFLSREVFIVDGRKSDFSITALTQRNCFTLKPALWTLSEPDVWPERT